MRARRRQLSVEEYAQGVRAGDRAILARAITLIESNAPAHFEAAQAVLQAVLPQTGGARRVGVTGVPGVGKSTFIEALGMELIEQGHKVAVLAVDPTSSLRGGSILGDKTRMARLSSAEQAFIRPSPTQGSLGGVHRKTREALLLCEAAGYGVVLVETVGVGQSETRVAEMVDSFLVLMLAGAGDELQGIKKGILEVADLLAITKADGENRAAAARARREYEGALHLLSARSAAWSPPVLTCSALEAEGVREVWEAVEAHRAAMQASGELERRRDEQLLRWLAALLEDGLMRRFASHPKVAARREALEAAVLGRRMSPTQAAWELLEAFHHG